MSKPITKAVILARGLGTRMQKSDGAELDPETARIAQQGLKALIQVAGRPFLDYGLQNLLDAGFTEICLIVPPGETPFKSYYSEVGQRLAGKASICFAVQELPRGTSDALAPAEDFAGKEGIVMVNADNIYSTEDLAALRTADDGCWVVGYTKDALTVRGNLAVEKVARMACVQMDAAMNLERIVEKPPRPEDYAVNGVVYVSMNLFRFSPIVFEACRKIEPHPVRGEYEITSTVQYIIDHKLDSYRVHVASGTVLDLSARADISSVRERLGSRKLTF
ncbi:MAG TPA: sugar phosphate nucleotidyltransferase [Candidatus Brocadiia bacterium]|nr:sugar phosphate nucleotidyltransferase [Candidatus Brocadiia bacterium]